jgi:hypothetical protein
MLEEDIRKKYKINIEQFYNEIAYTAFISPGAERPPLKFEKILLAGNYISKIKKMYSEQADKEFSKLTVDKLLILVSDMERNLRIGLPSEKDRAIKERAHRTLVAKRLLNEAIDFVGVDPFEKIINKGVRTKTEIGIEGSEKDGDKISEEQGGPAGEVLGECKESCDRTIRIERPGGENITRQGGNAIAV